MTQLRVKQIISRLRALYGSHLRLDDIGPTDKERDNKILSRCLAAHAVSIRTACLPEEAAQSVWDGSDDNGIDAVFVDEEQARVVIVQSKWINAGTGEPAADDIGTFTDGVRDIIEQNQGNFAVRLHASLLEAGQMILTPGCTVDIVLVSTGASKLAQHGTRKLDKVLDELNGSDDQEPIATKAVIGLNEVFSSLVSALSNDRISVEATITDWSRIAQPYPAYFGVIDGFQLKSWWSTYGKQLVTKNIRHGLGDTDVNIGITSTVTKKPENFWYFNNGITLIADEAIRAPSAAASRAAGAFQFKGASIVNGAQTVSTLERFPALLNR